LWSPLRVFVKYTQINPVRGLRSSRGTDLTQ